MWYLLPFHGNNGYKNMYQCYIYMYIACPVRQRIRRQKKWCCVEVMSIHLSACDLMPRSTTLEFFLTWYGRLSPTAIRQFWFSPHTVYFTSKHTWINRLHVTLTNKKNCTKWQWSSVYYILTWLCTTWQVTNMSTVFHPSHKFTFIMPLYATLYFWSSYQI
jgi:hypothetical protein